MSENERGVIKNREFALRVNDFSGLRYGNITPTDLDGFIDFGNKTFIFIESKYGDAEMPYGQELALSRLCAACHQAGRKSILLLASHHGCGDVLISESIVKKYFYVNKWMRPSGTITVRQAVDEFIKERWAGFLAID